MCVMVSSIPSHVYNETLAKYADNLMFMLLTSNICFRPLLQDFENKMRAAYVIQKQWRKCYNNERYSICAQRMRKMHSHTTAFDWIPLRQTYAKQSAHTPMVYCELTHANNTWLQTLKIWVRHRSKNRIMPSNNNDKSPVASCFCCSMFCKTHQANAILSSK
jgi:hypothetical protein